MYETVRSRNEPKGGFKIERTHYPGNNLEVFAAAIGYGSG